MDDWRQASGIKWGGRETSTGRRWLSWRRPSAPGRFLRDRLAWVGICSAILVLPGFVTMGELGLPGCLFLNISGIPCPFCGFTRALRALGSGNWEYALSNCPLAILLYAGLAALLVWHGTALILNLELKPGRLFEGMAKRRKHLFTLAVLLLVCNWMYRIAGGFR